MIASRVDFIDPLPIESKIYQGAIAYHSLFFDFKRVEKALDGLGGTQPEVEVAAAPTAEPATASNAA
nr:hypothetical protein [Pseudanabaena sp. UWO310]